MLVIVWYNPEIDNLCVTYPGMRSDLIEPGKTELEHCRKIASRDLPPGTRFRIVDDALGLPPSRRWRNAWIDDGVRVRPDIIRARAVRELEIIEDVEILKDQIEKEILILLAKKKPNLIKIDELQSRLDSLEQTGQVSTDLASINDLEELDAYTPAFLETIN